MILAPQPGIQPVNLLHWKVEKKPNHWTAREVPYQRFIVFFIYKICLLGLCLKFLLLNSIMFNFKIPVICCHL